MLNHAQPVEVEPCEETLSRERAERRCYSVRGFPEIQTTSYQTASYTN